MLTTRGGERDLVTDERVTIKYVDHEPIVYGSKGQFLRNIAVNEAMVRVEEEKKKIAEGKSHRTHIPLLGKYGVRAARIGCKYVDIETGKIYYIKRVMVKEKYLFKTDRYNRESKVAMYFLFDPETNRLVRPTDR